jgi:hypothetical protein
VTGGNSYCRVPTGRRSAGTAGVGRHGPPAAGLCLTARNLLRSERPPVCRTDAPRSCFHRARIGAATALSSCPRVDLAVSPLEGWRLAGGHEHQQAGRGDPRRRGGGPARQPIRSSTA